MLLIPYEPNHETLSCFSSFRIHPKNTNYRIWLVVFFIYLKWFMMNNPNLNGVHFLSWNVSFYRETIVGKYGRVYESYLRVPLEILILERTLLGFWTSTINRNMELIRIIFWKSCILCKQTYNVCTIFSVSINYKSPPLIGKQQYWLSLVIKIYHQIFVNPKCHYVTINYYNFKNLISFLFDKK